MHILMIPAWFQPESVGHHGIFVRDIARALAHCGHTVRIVSFAYGNKYLEVDDGNILEIFHPTAGSGLFSKLSYLKKTGPWLDEYCRRYGKPDIINTHGLSSIRLVSRWAHIHSLPIVHHEHLKALINPGLPFRIRWQARYFYQKVATIIAVSTIHADAIRKLTDTAVQRIPDVIDSAFFNIPLAKNLKAGLQVACISDLDPEKGYELLIEAVGLLAANNIDFTLHIVGDGPLRSMMERWSEEKGIRHRINLHGRQNRAGVLSILEKCHIYCTATITESFGMHIAEALAAGLYVVTTDCGSVHDYISKTNGTIVPQRSAVLLADALQTAITNYSVENVHAIRASIAEFASAEVVIPQIESVFRSVLRQRR